MLLVGGVQGERKSPLQNVDCNLTSIFNENACYLQWAVLHNNDSTSAVALCFFVLMIF